MSKIPDNVLKKFVSEIEAQAITSQKQITLSRAERQNKEKEKKIAELISKEVSSLKSGTNVYSAIGKAFIKEDINQIQEKLATQIKEINNEIDTLDKKILYHETTLANTQPHIQRIING
ncbi:unnamed protein product [Pneumocystis jirovecii]|uniref:Prefoldin subunit 1 n=2 Tax=Pneumocystis jirovecii TaxID=42068 RepID=L0PGC3_PNEJI|nr:uncharacterized protein T551_02040 [Pneumocystis jirovecii RU7]KTW30096.1 hypothetical protein T551_02040 [Pneumocystis jirovecii RU7]CCJ29724.1 unnamed protein product [Pneumocystis jirovecii]CCJ31421.1 unnamed protein product [Pneumocystis jirovecii]